MNSRGAGPLHRATLLTAAIVVAAILAGIALLPAATGDDIADRVLGVPDLSHRGGSSASVFGIPAQLFVDGAGHLYLAAGNRVLGWADAATFSNGQSADLVIGQPDFLANECNRNTNSDAAANTLCNATGVAADSDGNLYVADFNNNRVLEFDSPFTACGAFPCVAGAANRVFGQTGSFTTKGCAVPPSANTLCGPFGLAVDSAGNLYVADVENSRVIEYNDPVDESGIHPGAGDATADRVFGEPDFASSSCTPPSASCLGFPGGVAADAAGNLYVADFGNNRVVEYNTPLFAGGGPGAGDAVADLVFGQTNFAGNGCNPLPNASELCEPSSVAVDALGNLYVADEINNRVAEFNTPLNASSGEPGAGDAVVDNHMGAEPNSRESGRCNAGVLGGDLEGIGPDSMCDPRGVAVDAMGSVYVSDAKNDRVLRFNTPLDPTSGKPGAGDGIADAVLGQVNLNHPGGINRLLVGKPNGIAIDPAGHLYVSDSDNSRVLGWLNVASFTNGQSADIEIGQPDFEIGGCNRNVTACAQPGGCPTAETLCGPSQLAVDSFGDLFVADSGNNRVLAFTNPVKGCVASFPCVGGPATRVFGQSESFFGSDCNGGLTPSATTLCEPIGVALDSLSDLYVGDFGNNRVLEFKNPLSGSMVGGAGDDIADHVLGQPDFTSNTANNGGISNTSLFGPEGLTLDSADNLFVADIGNSRVLEYDKPFPTGASVPIAINLGADRVFGQGDDFTTRVGNKGGISAASLESPSDVTLDSAGNVYIVDAGNNRVLEFNTPLNAGSGETGAGDTTADRVFGQNGDFTKSASNRSTNPAAVDGVGPDSLFEARAATVDAQGNLYVGDSDNDRVLAFDKPLAPTPTPTATATATPTATPTPVNVTLKVKPKTLKLGTVAVGQSGNPKNVTVSNPKGSTKHPGLPVLIEMVEDPAEFQATNHCPTILPNGQKCTIAVVFTPQSVGARQGLLKIDDNAHGAPQMVKLKGKGK